MLETVLLNDEEFVKLVGPLNVQAVSEPSDKRRFPRFAVEFDVRCQGLNEAWEPVSVPFRGKVMNLSRGGILFAISDHINEAPLVDIQVLDGHSVLAETTISVVRNGQGIIAGQFVRKI